MPDSFAALPTWAIIAVFTVIGAAAGGSGTYFLRKRYPSATVLSYLPILAVLAGAALGTLIALPTIRAEATPVSCQAARDIAADANATTPGTKVDEVTTIIDMQVDCDRMVVVFRHAVDDDLTNIGDDVWALAQSNTDASLCRSPLWSRYADAGWILMKAYEFRDGGTRTLTAGCVAPTSGALPAVP